MYPKYDKYLCHVGDHVEGDVRESLMEVTANHTDPREWVPCIGTSLIESHHMSQVGQFCVFLNQTHLRSAKREKVRRHLVDLFKLKYLNTFYQNVFHQQIKPTI